MSKAQVSRVEPSRIRIVGVAAVLGVVAVTLLTSTRNLEGQVPGGGGGYPGTDWPAVGGNWSSSRYSTLTDITTDTVDRLGGAWVMQPEGGVSSRATPVVKDGVLYLTAGGSSPGCQARSAHHGRVEPGAQAFDEPIEVVPIKQRRQPRVEWMARRGGQVRRRDPQRRLIRLARSHSHARQCSTTDRLCRSLLRLSPRAAKAQVSRVEPSRIRIVGVAAVLGVVAVTLLTSTRNLEGQVPGGGGGYPGTDWPAVGGNWSSSRYSTLTDITTDTVDRLGGAWVMQPEGGVCRHGQLRSSRTASSI